MTLHPSLRYDIVTQEIEERARDAERRRFALEHSDQILRRSRPTWLRTIARIFRSHRAVRQQPRGACDSAHA